MFFAFLRFSCCTFVDQFGVEYESSTKQNLISTPDSLVTYIVPSTCVIITGGTYETSSFRKCRTKIKTVSFESGSNLETISNYVFMSSTLKTLDFSTCEKLYTLPPYLCNNCNQLTNVTLPPNLESIGTYCFYYCPSLDYIKFPITLKTISSYAFCSCNLSTVDIPYDSLLTKISGDCFGGIKAVSFFSAKEF